MLKRVLNAESAVRPVHQACRLTASYRFDPLNAPVAWSVLLFVQLRMRSNCRCRRGGSVLARLAERRALAGAIVSLSRVSWLRLLLLFSWGSTWWHVRPDTGRPICRVTCTCRWCHTLTSTATNSIQCSVPISPYCFGLSSRRVTKVAVSDRDYFYLR